MRNHLHHPTRPTGRSPTGHGYTLVELLVAFGVFTLFFGGLFALYRIGSNAFTAGSWKLTRQKEAQRFLQIVKERIEQASNFSVLTIVTGADGMTITPAPVYVPVAPNADFVVNDLWTRNTSQNILLFSVCKPNIGPNTGLWCGHAFKVQRRSVQLFSSAQSGAFSTGVAGFPPAPPAAPNAWIANPEVYQLGPNGYHLTLNDCTAVTLNWQSSTAPGEATGTKVINIMVEMVEAKDMESGVAPENRTSLRQSIRARIQGGVPVTQVGAGSMGS